MRQLFTTLGIKIPIVQAPMGGAVPVRLAAAVSNAGALGTLPLWRADLETLRGTVRKRRGLTSKPFAVNLVTEFSQQERLEVCLEEGVPIISFFWRDPGALVKRAKAGGGGLVIHHPSRRVIRLFQTHGLMSYLVVQPRMST